MGGEFTYWSDKEVMILLSNLLKEAKDRDLVLDRPHLSNRGRQVGNDILKENNYKGGEKNEK